MFATSPRRRDLLRGMSALGLAPIVLGAPAARASCTPDKLSVFTWAGYEVPELVGSYAAEHGVLPSYSFFASQEEALQKIRAGFPADTTHPCIDKVQKYLDAGLIDAIDTSRLTHWGDIWPDFANLSGVVIDGKNYCVPFDWGNTSFCYRTDVFGEDAEETWTWLFDPKYAGRIAMQDGIDSIVAGAFALGLDPYEMTEEDLERVKAKLIEQRPIVRFDWEAPTDYVNAMAAGEIDIAVCWNDGPVALKQQGVPVKLAQAKEGILTWLCGVIKLNTGVCDDDVVYDFLDAMLSPETGAFIIDVYGYGHANTMAFDLVKPERLAELGLSNPQAMMASSTFLRATPTRDAWDKAWEDVKAGV
jgi:spermidine/putrescine-binding protein